MSCVLFRGIRITKEEHERILGSPYSSWLFESDGCAFSKSYYFGFPISKTEENNFEEINPELFKNTLECESVLKAIIQKERLSNNRIALYMGEIYE